MEISKIAFLGASDALKPKIIMEQLKDYISSSPKTFAFVGEKETGKCLEYVRQIKMNYHILRSVQIEPEDIAILDKYDLIICLGWPYIIKPHVLQQTKCIFINCHGSYLPDYRGSRAYMHYWANISPYVGASVHYVTEGLDDGAILIRGKAELLPEDNLVAAHYRSCELSARQIPQAIRLVEEGSKGEFYAEKARYFYKCPEETVLSIRNQNIKTYPRRSCSTLYKIIDNHETRVLIWGDSEKACDVIEKYNADGCLTIHATGRMVPGTNADVWEPVDVLDEKTQAELLTKWKVDFCVDINKARMAGE